MDLTRNVEKADRRPHHRTVIVDERNYMEVKRRGRAVGPLELHALARRRSPLPKDQVDRGPEVDGVVRELEILQGTADVRLRDIEQLARCLVDADENTLRVDDDLGVRGALRGKLADPQLLSHVVGRFQTAR